MDVNSLAHTSGSANIILYLPLIIFERHANLKYRYENRHFGCRGYYVDTVGKNTQKIRQYINNQLHEDYIADQISLKEYIDLFMGNPVKKNR